MIYIFIYIYDIYIYIYIYALLATVPLKIGTINTKTST